MFQIKSKKISAARLAGGALVMLSGFVPIPHMSNTGLLMSRAQAAKITIPVTGKFITGITLSNKANLDFGKFVATKKTGTFGIKTDSGLTAGADGKTVSAPAAGKFGIKAAVNAAVDIKVSKIGTNIKLNNSAGGLKAGALTLQKILIGGVGTAVKTLTTGGGTTAKLNNVAIKFAAIKKTGGSDNTATFGAVLKWSGTRPIGAITNGNGGNIVLTIVY